MSLTAFLFAALALLFAPGPSNALMALAGAERGMARVVRLIPAEMGGYLAMILPLLWAGQGLLLRWPQAAILLKLLAAGWVLMLAVRLWRHGVEDAGQGEVSARHMAMTTVLNPKALVFGLVLLPPMDSAAFLLKFGLFAALVVASALGWGFLGQVAQGPGRARLIRRIASGWLALVSLGLLAGALRA